MDKFLIDRNHVALVIVDIQERLVPAMSVKDGVIKNCRHLIEAARLLAFPVLVTEQYPKGLGTTIAEIKDALPAYRPIEKTSFSCCGEPTFIKAIKAIGKRKLLLTGMETHVCVLQTALDLMIEGFEVHLVKDAVCSRTKANWLTGVEFMRDAGAVITSTEIVLFQVLKAAGGDEFKALSKLIK
ncbi:MAG: isochorismatase hydrolase [Nitrospirae bacterium]|nr:MAG: isochorismatase hydrolase [Nitrospirota bacterium]